MTKNLLVITSSLAEQVRLLLLLTAEGYIPTCCESLPSALTALKSSSFDAIITDPVIMDTPPQKMTAVELVSLIKETALNSETPILVMGDMISLQHIILGSLMPREGRFFLLSIRAAYSSLCESKSNLGFAQCPIILSCT